MTIGMSPANGTLVSTHFRHLRGIQLS